MERLNTGCKEHSLKENLKETKFSVVTKSTDVNTYIDISQIHRVNAYRNVDNNKHRTIKARIEFIVSQA